VRIFFLLPSVVLQNDKLAIRIPYQDKTNIWRWKSAKCDSLDNGNTWFIPC